ncbi:MAG: hypothetical protein ACLPZR_33770 [Solirubrobacteraceae bacterium]
MSTEAPSSATSRSPEPLSQALDRVLETLRARPPVAGGPQPAADSPLPRDESWHPLEHLRALFGLSSFEQDLLALCAGAVLDHRFDATPPSFASALSALDNAHWSAITPSGPLRYWRLIELGPGGLLDARLSLDERVLQFLLGVPAIDERLGPLLRPLELAPNAGVQRPAAVQIGTGHWQCRQPAHEPLLLITRQRSTAENTFWHICQALDRGPLCLDAGALPADGPERELLARLCTRETTLSGCALYLRTEHCEDAHALAAWIELLTAPVAVEVRPGTAAEALEGVRLAPR